MKRPNFRPAWIVIPAAAIGFGLGLPKVFAWPPQAGFEGRVVGVSDGDTLRVLAPGNKNLKIRLHGVDAPETKQPYGTRAKQFTSDQVFGKVVRVNPIEEDQYGRTVAKIIYQKDGANKELNLAVIEAGMGWWYRKFAPNERSYDLAERKAKAARTGLWADPNPTPPWQWRYDNRDR